MWNKKKITNLRWRFPKLKEKTSLYIKNSYQNSEKKKKTAVPNNGRFPKI